MAAKKRRWGPAGPDGKREEVWTVDFMMHYPDGSKKRISAKSPVQTKRGAEQWERERRSELLKHWEARKLGVIPESSRRG